MAIEYKIGEKVKHTVSGQIYTIVDVQPNKLGVTGGDLGDKIKYYAPVVQDRVFLEPYDEITEQTIERLDRFKDAGIDTSALDNLSDETKEEIAERLSTIVESKSREREIDAGQNLDLPCRKILIDGAQIPINQIKNGEEIWNILMYLYTYSCGGSDLARGGGRKKRDVTQEKTINSNWKPFLKLFFNHMRIFEAMVIEKGLLKESEM